MSALRGRMGGWWLLAAMAAVIALVVQWSFAETDVRQGARGQGSIAQASAERGLVPAVSRPSVAKADNNADDRDGFAQVAALIAAVAAFTLPARRARLQFTFTAPAPRPGSPTGARAPPVAPVV